MALLHRPNALPYSWLPQFLNTGRSFRLQSRLAVVPRINTVPYSRYVEAGITHCIENPGNGGNSAIPFGQRAMMTNGNFLIDAMGNSPFTDWDTNRIRAVVGDWLANGGGAAFMLDEIGEQLLNSQGRGGAQWNTSPQGRAYNEAMAEGIHARGGRYYGGYDGHGSLVPVLYNTDTALIRQILSDPNTALNYFRGHNGFGNGFYSADEHLFREGCLKFYTTNDDDFGKFVHGALMTCQADADARRALGTNRAVAVAVWPGYYEFADRTDIAHHVDYVRDVPAGGRMTRNTVPLATSDTQRAFFELLLLLCPQNDLYSWETPGSYGTDPNVASGDTNHGSRYEGSGARLAGMSLGYDPGKPTSYPTQPEGGQDLIYVAAETVSTARAWAGQGNQRWASHSSSRHGWLSVDQSTYLLDAYQQGHGLCRLGEGNGRRWVYYCNFRLAPGQWESISVDTGAGTLSVEAEGSQPYLWLI